MIIIFASCNASRYIADDQSLVKKVKLEGVDKQYLETALTFVQNDIRQNSRLNLALYNTFNTKNGKYRTDRIKSIGEAPHLLDSSLVEISRVQIEKFLATKGYFDAKVQSQIKSEKQKSVIIFTADQGPEFRIRDINYEIEDTTVAALYFSKKDQFSRLKKGQRFDSDSLAYEREQIYRLLKSNGYYDYVRQYVRFDVDSNLNSSAADLKLFLSNPADKPAHQTYTIDNSQVTILKSNGLTDLINPDTVTLDSQFSFIDHSGKFDAKPIARYMFLKKGNLYSIGNEELTYDRLYDLNVFRNLKIDFVKASDSTNRLRPVYEISPLKKMSNRIEGEYTFNAGRNGFNIGNTYTNRNVFGGAELLEVKAKYGVIFDANAQGSFLDRIFSRDLQLGVNIVTPKLLVPFRIPVMGKNGVPHTTISSNFQLFDQRQAFSSRVFVNSITYDWVETKTKLHSFTPVNIEFRKGKLDPVFRDSLEQRGFELYVRTNDRQFFNLGSQYAFTLNGVKLNSYSNFWFFRGTIDMAGNSLGLLNQIVKFKQDADGYRKLLGLPYQQYVKTEIDLRYYRSFGGERQFVARVNPGVGIAYGNSDQLTFEKNFFAGGSSGVRAWQARTLGPGNYNRAVLGSDGKADTLRLNLRNLDQLGEIKFEANLEYRFKIADNILNAKVKGATFADFGNVWRREKAVENPGGEFRFNKFIGQLAMGVGAGLRFDLNYFVFRLDAGFKVKDPQFTGSDQYVIKYLFNKKDFKQEYKTTHRPDVYRFVQYNFGIGMPF
ncbi:BamA/TamA family outer membrane protein [Daejeonella sp. H1SJ63]|uniref:translocation and assembly module lipoprotein TamL n=1 Tax=Daejeonella sp. H1SJ63 TaxID=3034145 RepID=UPI0023EBEAD1|nr:BamA/TamA family outer membrane protein [Daejeonella sp. H1SJ63]